MLHKVPQPHGQPLPAIHEAVSQGFSRDARETAPVTSVHRVHHGPRTKRQKPHEACPGRPRLGSEKRGSTDPAGLSGQVVPGIDRERGSQREGISSAARDGIGQEAGPRREERGFRLERPHGGSTRPQFTGHGKEHADDHRPGEGQGDQGGEKRQSAPPHGGPPRSGTSTRRESTDPDVDALAAPPIP